MLEYILLVYFVSLFILPVHLVLHLSSTLVESKARWETRRNQWKIGIPIIRHTFVTYLLAFVLSSGVVSKKTDVPYVSGGKTFAAHPTWQYFGTIAKQMCKMVCGCVCVWVCVCGSSSRVVKDTNMIMIWIFCHLCYQHSSNVWFDCCVLGFVFFFFSIPSQIRKGNCFDHVPYIFVVWAASVANISE